MINDFKNGVLHICELKIKKNKIGQLESDEINLLHSSFFQKRRVSNYDKELGFERSYSVDISVRIPLSFFKIKATQLILIDSVFFEIRNIYENFVDQYIDLVLGEREE